MKKIIIVIMILFLLCGCEMKVNDLKQVSDIAVLILQDEAYDTAYLDNTQVSLVEKLLV